MGRLWPVVAITACALLAAGCGPGDEGDGRPTATVTPMTSRTGATPNSTAAPADSAALPLCGDAKAAGNGLAADCRLVSRDRAGLSFVFRYSGEVSKRNRQVTVQVIGGGGVRQTFVETGFGDMGLASQREPALLNLADDGRDQLVIPILTGIVNSTFAIYRATDAAPDFVRSGEVGGISVDRAETGGYIMGESREGPGKYWYRDFWQFDGNQLRLVGATKTVLGEDHRSTCGPNEEIADKHPDLVDAALAQRFCAEKAIRAEPVG